jgi:hypothetical protein
MPVAKFITTTTQYRKRIRAGVRQKMIFAAAEKGRTEVLLMSELTYMDCWNFIAPLIPVTDDLSADIYVMVFSALKQAEKRRLEGKENAADRR